MTARVLITDYMYTARFVLGILVYVDRGRSTSIAYNFKIVLIFWENVKFFSVFK